MLYNTASTPAPAYRAPLEDAPALHYLHISYPYFIPTQIIKPSFSLLYLYLPTNWLYEFSVIIKSIIAFCPFP